ncbi:YifB family Mg chelatase-like AAA ATPase [Abyssisolibacter fermentans]|uniref:YifB family Mg chelatase-like AAA ATPase n=1 Tax=Abyssisolibacter fermentans TaxID=1766203 RepID=UPI00082E99EF|nr:YifB family Mg chelatase-like AAA ATPase [Abyssisolibacter fermentans]
MLSKVNTCVLQGLNGYNVGVETDISKGMPSFAIVGLPDVSIKESKERVRTAIKNSGFKFPVNKIIVNLAPANLRKEGSQIDLSIAVGILIATEDINYVDFSKTCFIGELSLDGKINRVDGALPMVISLKEAGMKKVIIPDGNKNECSMVDNIDIIPVDNLFELVKYLNDDIDISPCIFNKDIIEDEDSDKREDFSDIIGQRVLKRAVEVAAAGGHNILIIGPPGSSKTMIARRIPSILPSLTFEETLEITKIYSAAGLLKGAYLIKERPFRSPHHTISNISLIGGGRIPMPGEVSLAQYGVLFLDELPEFQKNALEVLRQPLEDGEVTISRVTATITYPSEFMLVASMNPCPCGYYGDPNHECTCSMKEINRYLGKISGPLLDRIDIHIEANPIKYDDLTNNNKEETSATIRERVNKARKIQIDRYSNEKNLYNANLSPKAVKKYCKLDKEGEELLKIAFNKFSLSARAYNKVLKVSRTIADLDNSENIKSCHIAEAIQYRSLDRKYWS